MKGRFVEFKTIARQHLRRFRERRIDSLIFSVKRRLTRHSSGSNHHIVKLGWKKIAITPNKQKK
jgi:hypothetical protein